MNAIVTLDSILEPSQAITPAALFGTGQIETIVSAIESQVRAEAYDIATPEGRERIKSVAYKIARSKTTLDEIGKEHVAEIKAQSAAIDKERKTLRDRLDALKEEVRKPVTDWEEAEANRTNGHESAIVAVIEAARQASGKPASLIRELVVIVEGYSARDWQEFKERADAAIAEALATLNQALAAAAKVEAERAELEALRAEAEALRAEKAAREVAEAEERRLVEQRAAAEREAAAAIEREKARAEQAKRDQEAAVARAVEQERERAERARIEAEQRAEREKAEAIEALHRRQEQEVAAAAAKKAAEEAAERRRQENTRHRNKVHAQIAADFMGNAHPMNPVTQEVADILIDLITRGKIRNLSITY
ncbi:hypothetical protein HU230_0011560 [Bradyrhizobium quebecense]|uniref:Cell envelope biogenesis protein TolA n=1 Tax=Bradyrhizobium quebecense TaxID=2748629 RepID=A0A973WNE0_9BRAD|nr:hypothetical protein [Bradyrhizobium quebecense]UGA46632.1 hypothetical protein HU230_0011560 [Bradyrhizobium quebecense]